ncbi:hypothetical protein ACYZTL_04540 [Pseudomonas sp. LB3P81]
MKNAALQRAIGQKPPHFMLENLSLHTVIKAYTTEEIEMELMTFESPLNAVLSGQEAPERSLKRRIPMTAKTKKLSDKEMDALERQIPDLAQIATKTAYARALLVSDSVLRVDSGDLVWISLDGSKTVVAKAKPRRKVKVGEVITVRRIEDQTAGGRA